MYQGDSFFTLSIAGQIGLAFLSAILALIFIYLGWRTTREKPLWLRLLIAIVLFFLFIWLMPQVYYTYYIFLLGVPWQIIIQTPPTPLGLARILFFAENANLSFHAQAAIGWTLLFIAMFRPRLNRLKPAL